MKNKKDLLIILYGLLAIIFMLMSISNFFN